jgi:putative colanic acid biosysnthesis UDP-glucose lipid carrier transferase
MAEENSGMIRPYSGALVELGRGLDAFLIMLGLWLTTRWVGLPWSHLCTVLSLFASLVFIVAASSNELYRSWRSDSLHVESMRVLACWGVAVLATASAAYLVEQAGSLFPQELAWRWFLLAPVLLLLTRVSIRLALRLARLKGHNYRRTAIVGSTRIAARLVETITEAPWLGLRFVGIYDDRHAQDERVHPELQDRIEGNIDALVRAAAEGDVDTVYITLPLRAELRIKSLIDRLSELPLTLIYVPDFFIFTMLNAQWQRVGNYHVVNVVATPFLGVSGLTKRLEDIVLTSLILCITAIPMLVIALAVKATSPGPVIFRQRRYGLNGREFEIWKFRTMTVTADGDQFVQASRNDPRVTSIGNFLRRTSLDELPQFINVLQGRMSIVGPRPHPVALDEQHRRLIPRYYFRHKIRPGITGLAQVRGFRGQTDTLDKMRRRIELDIEYIDSWSLFLDLKIILLTIIRGMRDQNAY